MGGKPRFGRFLIIASSSMIIFEINVDGITLGPAERDPPVSARADRIAAFVATCQGMELEAG